MTGLSREAFLEASVQRLRIIEELDHLEFWQRTDALVDAGRIGETTRQDLRELASSSESVADFQSKMCDSVAGAEALDATERKYLLSAVETPEGQPALTWEQSAAYVRAYGADPYQTTAETQRLEQDHQAVGAAMRAQ